MRATHFVVLSVFPCTRKSIDANIRTACRTYEKPTPYGVGFSLDYLSASLRRIREKTSVFERIKVAAHAATRTLGALFAIGTVLVVVLVGGVTRVAVVTTATTATVGTAVIAMVPEENGAA